MNPIQTDPNPKNDSITEPPEMTHVTRFSHSSQEKKRSDFEHPYLKQKIPFGLLPYVQSNLFAKYIRGDIDEYPCYINR